MSPRAAAFLSVPGVCCLSLAHFKYQSKFLQFVWISHLVSPIQLQHCEDKPPPIPCFPETPHGVEMCIQSWEKLFSINPSLPMFTYKIP